MKGQTPEHMAKIRSMRSPDFGKKVAATNLAKDPDFYKKIGAMGGKIGKTGGFASTSIGADGLTGKERAEVAGRKGGTISRKGAVHLPGSYAESLESKKHFWNKR